MLISIFYLYYSLLNSFIIISEYLASNIPYKDDVDIDISNHEKKILRREVESFADDFGYDLS